MFSISQIRAKARQTINSTPGIFLLPIIPVGLTLLMNAFQYFGNINAVYYDPTEAFRPFFSTFAFPILYNLLISFITISLAWTLLQVVRGVKKMVEMKDVLAIFNSPYLGKIFITFLLKQFYLFLWGLVFYIGLGLSVIAFILAFFYALGAGSFEGIPEESLAIIGAFFLFGLLALVGGLALLIPQHMAYSQVEYILYDQLEENTYVGANAVIKASRQMMKGYKGKRFVLDLSFIGWFILVGITIGIASIYVLPYYYAAQVHFYEALKTDMHIRQASYFNQFNQTTQEPTQPSEPTTTETVSEHVVEDTVADTLVDTAVENTAEQQMDSAIDSPLDHKE